MTTITDRLNEMAKWLCYFKHKWTHVIGSVKEIIPGAIMWTRECSRCKLQQDLSRTMGCTFLEAEREAQANILLEGKP